MADRATADSRLFGARDVTLGACATSAVVHAALVPQHADEPVLAIAFAGAATAAATLAFALTRPGLRAAPILAAALLASLLVAYPVVHLVTREHVDALDVVTKAVEAAGLLAALRGDWERPLPLAPLDAIVGVSLAVLLVSALEHGH